MLIDFKLEQQKQFDMMAERIYQAPEQYLSFAQLSDAYSSPWLKVFPKTTQVMVSGLDDGAEQYCMKLQFLAQYLQIDYAEQMTVLWCDRFGKKHVLKLDESTF
ncbi:MULTISPECIES: hypothetical protein [Acinetobacter]|jgi:hypothetical protein|uniref:Uncharacterized protein n=1 Tax=Acinetobacter chengduensis TaxID=2420890 RepID=A0ABX9TW38_9GAMM|nr:MULTISPECIES: hypothetical protein [Acinetobacter]MBI1450921.1 hypothetical protein [Acinetobacter sp. FL51]RKG41214.1 hypothetical protein D7V31_11120 [Acinetobacter sp. WCHAc060007]RLL21130.1 hypothetical protein D9K81_10385 [Acinetobacter chengduensis]